MYVKYVREKWLEKTIVFLVTLFYTYYIYYQIYITYNHSNNNISSSHT